MSKRRNHYRYKLYDQHQVVQFGFTNDPERREEEHRDEGKRFSTLKVEGPAVIKKTAEQWEEERLANYRRTHQGRNPRYNKTDR